MTSLDAYLPPDTSQIAAAPHRGRRRFRLLMDPSSPVLIIAGIALVAVGFVLIAIAWFQVSGLADVSLQMPYVVSAALSGLGLIVVGVGAVAIGVKRQESSERIRRLDRLESTLLELKAGLDSGSAGSPADAEAMSRR